MLTEMTDIAMEKLKCDISASDSSRRVTHREINPSSTVHDIYTCRNGIREDLRISFTRFRLSAHWLAVEVGRWNGRGRGRLPLEDVAVFPFTYFTFSLTLYCLTLFLFRGHYFTPSVPCNILYILYVHLCI